MGGDGMMSLVFFGLMFVIMYFFMIRPQVQKQKKERKFQESLERGTRIVTTSGIHGKVVEINGDIITVETGAGKIRFEKTAISQELTATRYANVVTKE